MSDNKNGNSGAAQWTKATTAAAAAAALAAHQQQQQQQHPKHYETNATNLVPAATATVVSTPVPSALYGGTLMPNNVLGSRIVAPPGAPDELQTLPYASARFQAPSIHHALGVGLSGGGGGVATAAALPSTLNPIPSSTVLTSVPSATSNVPYTSGFVPPVPFPTGVQTAVTSVLTPNPFAAANSFAGTCSASAPSFNLEQLQQINAQHYGISKIMAAAAASTASQALPIPLTTLATTTTATTLHGAGSTAVRQPTSNEASCSGAITNSLAESVMHAYSGGSVGLANHITPAHSRILAVGIKPPDEEKMQRLRLMVETGVSELGKQKIAQILDHVALLKPVEKLLLYMRLPGEAPETDPLRQPQNPLGTRSEINHTINWVRSHLEHDPQVSIPKQDVYNDYILYCERLDIKPLSTADFGKVMKQVFPDIRPRRLGTRGHSRYCYAAMRKTTKLTPPQLPHLGTVSQSALSPISTTHTNHGAESSSNNSSTAQPAFNANAESWDIVKNWAESMLQVKLDNMEDLVTRIKSQATTTLSAGSLRGSAVALPKKYTPREPKEKRLLADSGPLKKRRKKKRKGSSSSESSCNNNLNATTQQLPTSPTPNSGYNLAAAKLRAAGGSVISEDENQQETVAAIEVKQEIMDSPKDFCRRQHQQALPQGVQHSEQSSSLQQQHHHHLHHQHHHHQLMPINLAPEQRTVLAKAPAAPTAAEAAVITSLATQQLSAFGHVAGTTSTMSSGGYTAVKNLTPKIMELSSSNAPLEGALAMPTPSIVNKSEHAEQNLQTVIKEEIIDDYSTTNVVCKKVLKAHQTKGFWVNSPTAPAASATPTHVSSGGIPIVTTTASSPPPPQIQLQQSSPSTSSNSLVADTTMDNFLMGPPLSNTSISPIPTSGQQLLDANNRPKVMSRNSLVLARSKRRAALASANSSNSFSGSESGTPTPDLDKDADLPENLGLPRERVISICNMDKRELDEYFIPSCIPNDDEEEEEGTAQDQETELLQFFPTGDAEEKNLNISLGADIRNPASNATNSNNNSNEDLAITTTTTATKASTVTFSDTTNNNNNNNNFALASSVMATTTITTTATATVATLRATTIAPITPTTTHTTLTPIPLAQPLVARSSSTSSLATISSPSDGLMMMGGGGSGNVWKQSLTQEQQQKLAQKQLQQYAQQSVAITQTTTTTTSTTQNELAGTTKSTTTSAVVSASASLARMSQKHQLQQQQRHQQQQQQQVLMQQQRATPTGPQIGSLSQATTIGGKRRQIQVSSLINTPDSLSQAARKNYTFLPISPNINSTPSTTSAASLSTGNSTSQATTSSVCFASPGATRLRPRPALLGKQQSLDCDSAGSSDPMIGATRRRSYVGGLTSNGDANGTIGTSGGGITGGANIASGFAITTSASAPPSPSVYQQFMGNQWSNYNNSIINTDTTSTAFLSEQDSLDLDLLQDAMNTALNSSSNNNNINGTQSGMAMDFGLTPLSETQRSQSVPLSQLQRTHSPHSLFRGNAYGQNFSACPSMAPTPVPPEFADSSTLFCENSQSSNQSLVQQASGGSAGGGLKLDESGVLASDSTAIIDEVDVSELLSLPEFAHVGQSRTATTTTCSSAGSSSGYSSGACTTFGGSNGMMHGLGACTNATGISAAAGGGIISRSVPSTPLPYQTYNLFDTSGAQSIHKRLAAGIKNAQSISPMLAGCQNPTLSCHNTGNSTFNSMRSAYDISKSMPTTPTTPYTKFNYSPTQDFTRDYLINGNTIDSLASPFGGCCSDSLLNANDSLGVGGGVHDGSSNGASGVDDIANTLDAAAAGEVEAIMPLWSN